VEKLISSYAGLTRVSIFQMMDCRIKSGNDSLATAARAKGVTTMPEITISMASGRTDEQKAGMMRDITQALVKNLGIDVDAVVIQINEAPLAHKMKGGKTFVERAAAAKK
jgi:4-oxalocrotonate tautomerase